MAAVSVWSGKLIQNLTCEINIHMPSKESIQTVAYCYLFYVSIYQNKDWEYGVDISCLQFCACERDLPTVEFVTDYSLASMRKLKEYFARKPNRLHCSQQTFMYVVLKTSEQEKLDWKLSKIENVVGAIGT